MRKKGTGIRAQLNLFDELIIDNFAGGGGASTGIELATGRPVDIAINHNPEAIRLHKANHPFTKHYCESVWEVDPREVCQGRKVALCWFSPDCTHFSKARGGTPKKKEIRGLAWVALRWAATVKPRVIILENVEEFRTWGPLGKDGQPLKEKQGQTFNSFVNALRRQGYKVEYKELRACDYGAPTIRKRFFLIARCDGKPIVFPEPTHGPEGSGLLPYKTAADIIDWSLPTKSIFGRKKPLADNTLRRIARGLDKYVIKDPAPFLIQVNHAGENFRGQKLSEGMPTVTAKHGFGIVSPVVSSLGHTSIKSRSAAVDEPLRTVVSKNEHCIVNSKLTPYIMTNTTNHSGAAEDTPLPTIATGGHHFQVSPYLLQYHTETQEKQVRGQVCDAPLATVDTNPRYSIAAGFISPYYAGGYQQAGQPADKPLPTVTAIDHNCIAAVNMTILRNNMDGKSLKDGLNTITSSPGHFALQQSFLTEYYGNGRPMNIEDPLHTITAKARQALLSVRVERVIGEVDLKDWPQIRELLNKYCDYNLKEDEVLILNIGGMDYFISSIGLRMLQPRELYNAQGFPPDYIIDMVDPVTGKSYSKKEQIARCGNAVPPPFSEALCRSNLPELCGKKYHTMEDLQKDIAV